MKIYLNETKNKREISSVRSQIKDKGTLKRFDEFVNKHDYFDFNNDDHIKLLKKDDCHCQVNTTVNVRGV